MTGLIQQINRYICFADEDELNYLEDAVEELIRNRRKELEKIETRIS